MCSPWVDAYFLGQYAGAQALTAVTLMFPLYMLMIALMTLVSNGFSKHFRTACWGPGTCDLLADVFAQGMTLAVVICTAMMALFWLFGSDMTLLIANGDAETGTTGASVHDDPDCLFTTDLRSVAER